MESKLGNTRQIGFEARRTWRGQPCNIIVFSYHHIFTFSYFHIIIFSHHHIFISSYFHIIIKHNVWTPSYSPYILYSRLNIIIFHILRMKIGFKSEARCWRLPDGSNVLQIGTNFDKLYKYSFLGNAFCAHLSIVLKPSDQFRKPHDMPFHEIYNFRLKFKYLVAWPRVCFGVAIKCVITTRLWH